MDVLRPDSTLSLPCVTVLKASAGSGKTYTLTARYVQFALSRAIPCNGLANILAVTFSNNASREMKENVLLWLKRLALRDSGAASEIGPLVGETPGPLAGRAEELLDGILHRWEEFQVRTIDSFSSAVFRASALDFGYPPGYEIVLDSGPLIDYAFDLLLREAREGTPQAALLDDAVRAVLGGREDEAGFPWDPAPALRAALRDLEDKLAAIPSAPAPRPGGDRMEALERAIGEALEGIGEAVEASGLERSSRSAFPRLLRMARGGRYASLIGESTKSCPVKKPAVGGARAGDGYDRIAEAWSGLNVMIGDYAGLSARSWYAPYLALHAELDAVTDRVKRARGQLALSDVARRLAAAIDAEAVPDVYFRLGERIFHFLIDEFQDTSPIQWRTLFPLVENALASGGSLFAVGDTKQAIYKFRGADYRIMRAMEDSNPFPSSVHETPELAVNRRSRPRVLAFARRTFQGLAAGMDEYREAVRRSGLDSYRQEAVDAGTDPGYVEALRLLRDDGDPPERERLLSAVADLRDRGYRHGEIAVLAPRNADVARAASWLSAAGVPFLSYSSLDARLRGAAGEVLALLAFLDSPPDDLSFATFLLGGLMAASLRLDGGPAPEELHSFLAASRGARPLYKAFQRAFPAVWERRFSLLFRSAGYLPLYDLVSEALTSFDALRSLPGEQATFARMLEAVKDFEGSGENSLRDFLRFAGDAEGGEWTLEVPRGTDSVRLMTVHKSKGLGFQAVILLLYARRQWKTPDWALVEAVGGVELVKVSRKLGERDSGIDALYGEKRIEEKVDALNALYVALTRARREMHVLAVGGEKEGFPLDILPFDEFPPSPEKPRAPVETPREDILDPLEPACGSVAAAKVRGRLNHRERRRGDLLHRILSLAPQVPGAQSAAPGAQGAAPGAQGAAPGAQSAAPGSLEAALGEAARRAAAEMRIPEEPDLPAALARSLRAAGVADRFLPRPGVSVFTERELCDGNGRLFRLDRLEVEADRVTVLDWKSGSEDIGTAEQAAQMRGYLGVLGGAFPGRKAEAILVQVDRGEARVIR